MAQRFMVLPKRQVSIVLESGTWKQIVSEIPDSVTSLAVDGDTLYVGTKNSGMLHFNLEK